jgi:hypothetical protein
MEIAGELVSVRSSLSSEVPRQPQHLKQTKAIDLFDRKDGVQKFSAAHPVKKESSENEKSSFSPYESTSALF